MNRRAQEDCGDDDYDRCFICPGFCRAAVVQAQSCQDQFCNRVNQPLVPVKVVYQCPHCSTYRKNPGRCENEDCVTDDASKNLNPILQAKALVPRHHQLPILDPDETSRSYSSVWNGDDIGTGHARSCLSSPQAWNSIIEDLTPWVILDAGKDIDSVAGIVVGSRRYHEDSQVQQWVTKLSVDISNNNEDWRTIEENIDTQLMTGPINFQQRVLPFKSPSKARYFRIRPLLWKHHCSLRVALLLTGREKDKFYRIDNDNQELLTIFDVLQLPAHVPITFIPGGPQTSLAGFMAARKDGPLAVVQVPNGDTNWCNRQIHWDIYAFNGRPNPLANRVFCVAHGQKCSIGVRFETHWDWNSRDYCPGCIIQLYFGIAGTFCQGVIETGIHHYHGSSETTFVAPSEPGLYYITQSVSLQYNYINNLHAHINSPNDSFGVLRVLPTRFTANTWSLLTPELERFFIRLLAFRRREGTIFSMLSKEIMLEIFSFLLDPENAPPQVL